MSANELLVDTFVKKAEAISAFVYKVGTLEEAVSECISICNQKGKSSIAVPEKEIKDLFNCDLKIISEDIYENRDKLELSFTQTDAAIADTGSIVLNSSDENLRIATMLCDIHVAVVKQSSIVKSPADLSEKLKSDMANPANYTAFISGASRTADIERVLAIGVHGPLELHLIIMEDI